MRAKEIEPNAQAQAKETSASEMVLYKGHKDTKATRLFDKKGTFLCEEVCKNFSQARVKQGFCKSQKLSELSTSACYAIPEVLAWLLQKKP